MLPERLDRINNDGSDNEIRLLNAFLNPLAYNNGGTAGTLSAADAAGSLIRGLSGQVGNELDEFVTESVRDTLLGLPLDLPAINLTRGRSEGIPPLNEVRRQIFAATQDPAVQPYANWNEFRFALKHDESFANFLAAYGTDPRITGQTTLAGKRNAALLIALDFADPFLSQPAATSGLDNVDLWVGGMAEKQAVFGGLLGSTFNYVFELQLEHLQDGDRFYYLQRLDGTNLVTQLEGNSLAELARRNSSVGATMDIIFKAADFNLQAANFTGTATVPLGPGISVFTLADGTKVFFDQLHSGKNIVINGTTGNDKWKADVGDDSIFGNAGNDRLDGFEGNDTLLGGDGDDVLLGGNGDDVLKGGPGNDALQTGPGFGADLVLGGTGNDFASGGDDGNEYFMGPGNDIVVDGSMRAEAIIGGEGDDWLDGGSGHDAGLFGDEANNFDLLAGLNVTGGDDVEDGGPGQDNLFGFGGDEVYLMSEGTDKFFGDYGFDWITLRGWNQPQFIELSLLALPNVPVNFNDLRNRYRFVDGASGWNLDDHIAGSDAVLCDPPGEVAECLTPGMELTVAGAAKISGLTELMGPAAFNKPLNAPAIPGVKDVGFMGGDILLGGLGNDTLEGKLGDDLIDGDAWLNVQLRAVYNNGTVRFVDSARALTNDIFSDPQRLNPGNITIVKSIVDATLPNATVQVVPPPDCTAAVPRNCDTAVFAFPSTDYTIVTNANGTVTVTHVPAAARDIPFSDGTDTLRNVERALFADGVIVDLANGGNSVATGTVTISDTTPTEDQVLTATQAITDANGFNPATIVFNWEMETTPGIFAVVGTGATFTPGDPQVGHALRVVARFTDNGNFAEAVRSDATAVVANINDLPVGAPTVTPIDPQEGEAIFANPGAIVDADGLVGVTFGFQWQQAGGTGVFTNITGANSAAFIPGQAQVNRVLRVAVTFVDNHGTGEAIVSAPSGVVGDLFVGTAAADTYNGTAGRDNISGLAGNDTLSGTAGNDTIAGGPGDDILNGGAGDDVFLFTGSEGFDDVGGGLGTDQIRATANNTVIGLSAISGVESITSGGFANVRILGSDADNTFGFGGATPVTLTGIVSIDGGGGNDTINGTALADTILGGAGADTLNGGLGNDVLTGGPGNDVMNGGAGLNIFRFAAGSNADTINGFDANPTGGQDLLDISARGITAATFAAQVSIRAVGADTVITIGTGATADTIRLVGVAAAAVTVQDFILAQ